MVLPIDLVLSRLEKLKKSGDGWIARCPAHDDRHPSLKISVGHDNRVLIDCKAGCTHEQICHAIGIAVKDLFVAKEKTTNHILTIEELAQAKDIPAEFLLKLGVSQAENGVIIPYFDKKGKPARQRKRTHLVAKEGSYWEGKGKIMPYGLWVMGETDILEELAFVEGESDPWTLWYCGYPGLGIPGAQMTKVLQADHIAGIQRLYLIEESDKGGETFVKGMLARLEEIRYPGKISIAKMESTGVKDINDLYRKLGKEKFQEAYHQLLNQAIPPHTAKETQKVAKEEPPMTPLPPITPLGKSLKSLQTKEFAPINWAVEGILPEGSIILAGKPKMGKSALALNIALSIACGGVALAKIAVEKGEVLYLALEDGERRLKERIAKIMRGTEWPDSFYYDTECPNLEKGGLLAIEEWLKAHQKARLVVVDTLAKVRPPQTHNESIYDRDYRSVQGLKKLADTYHVAILIIHHTRKAEATDPLETVSGSFGLTGGVDALLILKRERSQADAVLHVTGREIEENDFALSFNFPHWELLGDAEQFRLSKERHAILDVLKESNMPMSPKDIFEALKAQGINRSTNSIQLLLSKMAKEGIIKTPDYGKYQA